MKGSCSIRIDFPSAELAKAALASLRQEQEFKKRSISKIKAEGKALMITISADDAVALRATVNSYLRGVQLMESVEGEI